MCFKKKNEPIRLAKKPENRNFKLLNDLLYNPMFWFIIIFIILFVLSILFAYKNATPEKVYNLGNITIR